MRFLNLLFLTFLIFVASNSFSQNTEKNLSLEEIYTYKAQSVSQLSYKEKLIQKVYASSGQKLMRDKPRQIKHNSSYHGEIITVLPQDFILVDDKKINDEIGLKGRFTSPSIAKQPNGDFIVCWSDDRNTHFDIFAQLFDANGNPAGQSFRVNDDNGSAEQNSPAIYSDNTGAFTIAWHDGRSGNSIFAQNFDAAGNRVGSNYPTPESQNVVWHLNPDIVRMSDGSVVISWTKLENLNYTIWLQKFTANGIPDGNAVQVNDVAQTESKWGVQLAVNTNDELFVTWMQSINNKFHILARRYLSDTSPIGNIFQVNTNAGDNDNIFPVVVFDNNDNALVTWAGRINGFYNIYMQRFNNLGNTVGTNVKVNTNVAGSTQIYPDISVDQNNNYIICWRDDRDGDDDTFAQRYNSNDVPQGTNFKVNDDNIQAGQLNDAIAVGQDGKFVIVWEDNRNANQNIFAQLLNENGTTDGANFKVNENVGAANRYNSFVSTSTDGKSLVTWTDERNGNADIYTQLLDGNGNGVGNNIKLNDDVGDNMQNESNSAALVDGSRLVVWEDARNDDGDIFAQLVNPDGQLQGQNIKVSDAPAATYQGIPAVAASTAGEFLVVWVDDRNPTNTIFGQRINSDGTPNGGNFVLNDSGNFDLIWGCNLVFTNNGGLIVVWKQLVWGSGFDVFMQMYNTDYSKNGGVVKVNEGDRINFDLLWRRVGIDAYSDGSFVIAWSDDRNGNNDVYAQLLNADGSKSGGNVLINDDEGESNQSSPSVGIDTNDNLVIVWLDSREGQFDPSCYAQKFAGGLNKFGANSKIQNTEGLFIQTFPVVSFVNDAMNFVWEDARETGKGNSIYFNRHRFTELSLTSPAGNEAWEVGRNYNIGWNASTNVANVKLELSIDGGTNWQTEPIIASADASNAAYDWSIPNFVSDNCVVRVSSAMHPSIFGVNIVPFSITASIVNAPTELAASAPKAGKVQLDWTDNSDNEIGFKIERRITGGEFDEIAMVLSDVQSFTDETVAQVTNYEYRVKAYNDFTESGFTNISSVLTLAIPILSPSQLSLVSNEGGRVEFSWVDNSDNETGFKIERKESDGEFIEIATVNSDVQNFVDETVKQAVTYEYRMKAFNEFTESDYSEPLIVTTIPNSIANPDQLSATTNEPGKVEITWNDNSDNETGFKIERKTTGSDFIEIAMAPANTTGYNDESVEQITEYEYRVKAFNEFTESVYSNTSQITTLAFPINTPTFLTVESNQVGQVEISWKDNSNNEDGFILERKEADTEFSEIATINADATAYTDETVGESIEYEYRLKAFNEYTESDYSTPAKVTTITSVDDLSSLPTEFHLYDNYPNPFNPTTTLRFAIPEQTNVRISVFSILGLEVAELLNETKNAGYHTLQFNASKLASGTYIYKIEASSYVNSKKMLLVK